jgi:hypothetical protein
MMRKPQHTERGDCRTWLQMLQQQGQALRT